jgi:hypothetical protein
MGTDSTKAYTPSDLLSTEFYRKYKHILDEKRGAGFWLWKPFLIRRELELSRENDIIIYADAGLLFRKNLKPLVKLVESPQHMAVFCNDIPLGKYTKRDLLIAADCDNEQMRRAPMIHAGLQIYRNCAESRMFLDEVLKYCTMKDLITDAPGTSGLREHPEYSEHRHDQSVFSVLAHKSGKTVFLDPTQYQKRNSHYLFGSGQNSAFNPLPYRRIAYVHRYRNNQIHHLVTDVIKKLLGA